MSDAIYIYIYYTISYVRSFLFNHIWYFDYIDTWYRSHRIRCTMTFNGSKPSACGEVWPFFTRSISSSCCLLRLHLRKNTWGLGTNGAVTKMLKAGHHGDIVGYVLPITWGYNGNIMGISWGYNGDIVGISWYRVFFWFQTRLTLRIAHYWRLGSVVCTNPMLVAKSTWYLDPAVIRDVDLILSRDAKWPFQVLGLRIFLWFRLWINPWMQRKDPVLPMLQVIWGWVKTYHYHIGGNSDQFTSYPLVNVYITMENHHF